MIAARGGADPAANARLRLVIEQARKVSMPKDTLERAIKKGAGLTGEAVHFEHPVYEGFAPHRIPVMVECLTDNVNRAASDMRVLFRKGQLGTSGSVSWDFEHVGMVEAEPAQPGADAEMAAIEAGAQDFEPGDDGATLFLTDPADLDLVSRALAAQLAEVLAATDTRTVVEFGAGSGALAEQLAGGVGDEEVAAELLAGGLDAGGGVDDVADERVVEALGCADVAGDGLRMVRVGPS